MPRGIRRFDRRIRPTKSTENTDVFPAIKDPIDDEDAVTGAIKVPEADPATTTTSTMPQAMLGRRTSRPNRLAAAMTGRHSCVSRPFGSASICGAGWCI